jgi:hypothetical protein
MSNTTLGTKVIKNKLGVLELAKQLGNVSRACKLMGYVRHEAVVSSCLLLKETFLAVG